MIDLERSWRMLKGILITLLFMFSLPLDMTEAQEAHSIITTLEISPDHCFPGDVLWVNGTALYDNGTSLAQTEVIITIEGNPGMWTTVTDGSGHYSMAVSAKGLFVDQMQPEAPVPSGYTDNVKSGTWIGQTFKANATELHSIDIYLVKSTIPGPPSPSSSVTVCLKDDPNATTEMGNSTLGFYDIIDGWNRFVFPSPMELTAGEEYFILLTSNTTTGGYRNYGGEWSEVVDAYADGMIYWTGSPIVPDAFQDMGFFTYYEDVLLPGTHNLTVNVTGYNSTATLYGSSEAVLTVNPPPTRDIFIAPGNVSVFNVNDPHLEGDFITVNATIQNLGDAEVADFVVDFSLDSESSVFHSEVLNLAGFETGNISIQWPAEKGNHTIIVTADPDNLISEELEDNNNASISIFVDGDNDHDGTGDLEDRDDDNDGYSDVLEEREGTDPMDVESKPADNDLDFIPDSTDPDDDNDGYTDVIETEVGTDPYAASSVPLDFDSDGIPDVLDPDMDDDGVGNSEDVFPLDTSEWLDTDDDGIGDNADTDDDSDGLPDGVDAYPLDTDNDGMNNSFDWDDDADGILDTEDTWPLDTDNDGLTNAADADDDGDGLADEEERRLGTDSLRWDTDGDGVGDRDDYDPLDSGVTEEPEDSLKLLFLPSIIVAILLLAVVLLYRRMAGVSDIGEELRNLPDDYTTIAPAPQARGQEAPKDKKEPETRPSSPEPLDELSEIEEEFEEPLSSVKEKETPRN